MTRIALIILHVFVDQAYAKESAINHTGSAQNFFDKLADKPVDQARGSMEEFVDKLVHDMVDKLFKRLLKVSPWHYIDMENTTLRKAGHLSTPQRTTRLTPSLLVNPQQATQFPRSSLVPQLPSVVLPSSLPVVICSSSFFDRVVRSAEGREITFNGTLPDASALVNELSENLQENLPKYFAALRLGAATALTASLETQEQQRLLEKIQGVAEQEAKPSGDDDPLQRTKPSVGETIAGISIQEAQRQKAQWEREKEILIQNAEMAARERVEKDLLIQEQRLLLEELRMVGASEEEQINAEDVFWKSLSETNSSVNSSVNPVLGEAVLDLGYKRVHVVSAKTLTTIPIWKKQRIYRQARAKAMAADKLATAEMGLPGIIALYEDDEGQLSILDGQHRVGMMAIMGFQNPSLSEECSFLKNVLVEVFPKTPKFNPQDIFSEINKAEPIKLVDMPGMATQKDNKVITSAVDKLELKYREMFKPSQRCRAPHVNNDNLRDAIFASNVIKRHSLTTSKSLVDWCLAQNGLLKLKYDKEPPVTVSEKVLAKAKKYDFFLGLDTSWLYN